MRDLVFKNITSRSRDRKILASSEVVESEGTRSIIHRHFIYLVREVADTSAPRPAPYLYVLRKQNTKDREERFFCRIKGSLYAANKGRLYLILFMHSLKINLAAVAEDVTS